VIAKEQGGKNSREQQLILDQPEDVLVPMLVLFRMKELVRIISKWVNQ
jgi:hypothetical protein